MHVYTDRVPLPLCSSRGDLSRHRRSEEQDLRASALEAKAQATLSSAECVILQLGLSMPKFL